VCARLRPAAGARFARLAPAVPLSYVVRMTHVNAALPDTARDDGGARRLQRAATTRYVTPHPHPTPLLPYLRRWACRRLPGPRPRLLRARAAETAVRGAGPDAIGSKAELAKALGIERPLKKNKDKGDAALKSCLEAIARA